MPRGPGQRAGLTRAAVLDTAHALLAEEGLDALTMRALARRLGVAPNALYSHVPGKTELVDALLDDRLSLVAEPDPDAPDPVAALAALMTSTYEVLLGRPGLVPLYLARQGSRGPNAVRLGVTMDALLARLGLAARRDPLRAAGADPARDRRRGLRGRRRAGARGDGPRRLRALPAVAARGHRRGAHLAVIGGWVHIRPRYGRKTHRTGDQGRRGGRGWRGGGAWVAGP